MRAPSANTRRRAAIALAFLITIAALYGLAHTFATNWSDVRRAVSDANWALLACGLAVSVLSVALLGQRWHATLTAMGADVPLTSALRWFFTGQLGKYAPGGVWHVVGQGELAARGGVARRVAYSSVLVSTATLVGSAAFVVAAGAVLPIRARAPWWAVVAGAGITAVFLEPHFRRWLLRKSGVAPEDGHLAPARLLRLMLGHAPAWLAVGLSTWLIARAFDPGLGAGHVIIAAIASWLVGIVTLPAPGGIGVREAVFAAALRSEVGDGPAALIALTARMVFVLSDVAWFVAARVGSPVSDAVGPAPSSTATD